MGDIDLFESYCVTFFNDFLIEHVQPRLLRREKPRLIRSTLQYLIQIIDILTCPRLIVTMYRFLFGFPDDYLEEVDDKEVDPNLQVPAFSHGASTNTSASSKIANGNMSA